MGLLLTICVRSAIGGGVEQLPAILALLLISIALIAKRLVEQPNEGGRTNFPISNAWMVVLVWSVVLSISTFWLVGPFFLLGVCIAEALVKKSSFQSNLSETSDDERPDNETPELSESNQTVADEIVDDDHDCSNDALLLSLCQQDGPGAAPMDENDESDESTDDVIRKIVYTSRDNEITVVASIRQSFAADENSGVVHIPFYPSLAETPAIEFQQLAGPPINVKITDATRFGIRAEIKLIDTNPVGTEILIKFLISHVNQQKLSAAG